MESFSVFLLLIEFADFSYLVPKPYPEHDLILLVSILMQFLVLSD